MNSKKYEQFKTMLNNKYDVMKSKFLSELSQDMLDKCVEICKISVNSKFLVKGDSATVANSRMQLMAKKSIEVFALKGTEIESSEVFEFAMLHETLFALNNDSTLDNIITDDGEESGCCVVAYVESKKELIADNIEYMCISFSDFTTEFNFDPLQDGKDVVNIIKEFQELRG